MKGLGQETGGEFASNFADSLAGAATSAGEYDVAKRGLLRPCIEKFGENPKLRRRSRTTWHGSTWSASPPRT